MIDLMKKNKVGAVVGAVAGYLLHSMMYLKMILSGQSGSFGSIWMKGLFITVGAGVGAWIQEKIK